MVSLHAHNEVSREKEVLGWLNTGEDLALVSDAGTPLVSDPGCRLVQAILEKGHKVVPVPGPSAVLAALVGSGLPMDRFSFLGFPPRKGKERRALLERVAESPETTVLFESPERLVSLLTDLAEIAGPDRRGVVARELTKLYEEFVRGTMTELRAHFQENSPRGEITLVLAPALPREGVDPVDEAAGAALARTLLDKGERPSQVAREVARRLGIPRNRAYQLVQALPETGLPDRD
jgi:16S rRNA (cytidine1402-2'-O)-methyltransferase